MQSMTRNFVAYQLVIDYSLIIGNNQWLINWLPIDYLLITHWFHWCHRLVMPGIQCTLQRLCKHMNNLHDAAFKRLPKKNLNPTSSLIGDPFYLSALYYLWHFIILFVWSIPHLSNKSFNLQNYLFCAIIQNNALISWTISFLRNLLVICNTYHTALYLQQLLLIID